MSLGRLDTPDGKTKITSVRLKTATLGCFDRLSSLGVKSREVATSEQKSPPFLSYRSSSDFAIKSILSEFLVWFSDTYFLLHWDLTRQIYGNLLYCPKLNVESLECPDAKGCSNLSNELSFFNWGLFKDERKFKSAEHFKKRYLRVLSWWPTAPLVFVAATRTRRLSLFLNFNPRHAIVRIYLFSPLFLCVVDNMFFRLYFCCASSKYLSSAGVFVA